MTGAATRFPWAKSSPTRTTTGFIKSVTLLICKPVESGLTQAAQAPNCQTAKRSAKNSGELRWHSKTSDLGLTPKLSNKSTRRAICTLKYGESQLVLVGILVMAPMFSMLDIVLVHLACNMRRLSNDVALRDLHS